MRGEVEMTIEQMKEKKKELGYTNEQIAELSGVPLGTVQKIFAGETKSPRYDTVQKLVKILDNDSEYDFSVNNMARGKVAEHAAVYDLGLYNYGKKTEKKTKKVHNADYSPVPIENRLGIAAGKYNIPDDIDFCNDEIWEDFWGNKR